MADQDISRALGRKTFDFVDCDGANHRVPALTVADLADLEKELGPMADWGVRVRDQAGAALFIWHALRKEGLTREQVRKREWKWTVADVADMFVLGDSTAIEAVIGQILAVSGMERRAGAAGRPTQAPAPTSGPTSSPEPSPVASPPTT